MYPVSLTLFDRFERIWKMKGEGYTEGFLHDDSVLTDFPVVDTFLPVVIPLVS